MDNLPSSQAPNDTVPQLFREYDGSQIPVFVEAGGIIGRPKLVRVLKRAGASICNDPKQASYILVDSSSEPGRQFIRDWGKDENKVVLEYTWVSRSITAGRLLKESDQWGGCITFDDGLLAQQLVKEETDDALDLNPLPTPRVTPVAVASSSRPRHLNRPPAYHTPITSSRPGSSPDTPDGSSYANHDSFPAYHHLSQQGQPNMSRPYSQPQPPMQPAHAQSTLANIMSQYQLQFARDTTHIPPHLMSLLSQQSMPPPQYEQPMPQQGPSLDSFLTALSDVMRTHGISPSMPWGPGQVMPPSSQLPHHNEQQEMNHTMQPIQSPAILHNGSNSHSSTTSRSTPSVEIPSDRSSPVSGVLPPSFRRKSSPVHPTSPELRPSSLKEKQRAVSPNPLRRRPPYVGPSRSPHEAVTSPRSTQTGKVFTSATGEELAFFVQIDLSNRFSVVSSIKKNGGKIINNHTTADYAILYSRSKTFPNLLKSTISADKPAVSAAFVHDSVTHNALMDPTEYLFELPNKPKRKRRQAAAPVGDEEEEEEGPPVRKQRNKEVQVDRGGKVKTDDPEVARVGSVHGRRSPTPPPEHTRKSTSRGFIYSEHERDYVKRYATVLLERDHQMTSTAIAQKLYQKMPNHTLKSWSTFVVQMGREDIQAIRKRMSIAYRKAQSQTQAQEQTQGLEDMDNSEDPEPPHIPRPSPTPAAQESPEDPENDRRRLEEEDFGVICQFFATGGGDEGSEDDSQIWARLTGQAECQTASTWEEFYNNHHVEVNARYNRLTGTTEDISAGLNYH